MNKIKTEAKQQSNYLNDKLGKTILVLHKH